MIDRKAIIDAGAAHGWIVSFGYEKQNSIHFYQQNHRLFLDIYLSMDDSQILEAWSDRGRVEPDVAYLIDYLQGKVDA